MFNKRNIIIHTMSCILFFLLPYYSYPIELIDIEREGKNHYATLKINEKPIDKICLDYNKSNTDIQNWKIHSSYKTKEDLVKVKLPRNLPKDHYYAFRLYSRKRTNWTKPFYLTTSNRFTMDLPDKNNKQLEKKDKEKKNEESKKEDESHKSSDSSNDNTQLISIIVVGGLVVFVIMSVALTSFCN